MEDDNRTDCVFLTNPCERIISREVSNWRLQNNNMPMLALVAEQGCVRELELFEKVTDPCHGALSLGEIGTTGKDQYPLFHNATIVALRYA